MHDRMTECPYPEPLTDFASGVTPAPVSTVPVMAEGRAALERINDELGLAFDDWDLDFYTALFRDRIGRDPTDVECFDIAQSNSEHSRHWFFKGRLVIDGEEMPDHLFDVVRRPLRGQPATTASSPSTTTRARSVASRSTPWSAPTRGGPSPLGRPRARPRHHFHRRNPQLPLRSGAVPRRRDRHRRSHPRRPRHRSRRTGGGRHRGLLRRQSQTARLRAPLGRSRISSTRRTSPLPLAIEIEASNGASDYGNKFGEPVIRGLHPVGRPAPARRRAP